MQPADQQALRATLVRKDIHGRLAGWLDFLAEYSFKIRYLSGKENLATEFLSPVHRADPAPDFVEEGEVTGMMLVQDVVELAISQLDPTLQDVFWYLAE